MSVPVRPIGRILAALVLLATGALGLYNGVQDLSEVENAAQRLVMLGVLLYGVLGVPAGVGVLRRRWWGVALAGAWAVTVSLVGPAATAYFGGEPLLGVATLAAFAGSAAVAFVVWWLARRGVEEAGSPAPR